jgi:hypothetical protein
VGAASQKAISANAAAGLSFAAQRLVGGGWDQGISVAILLSSFNADRLRHAGENLPRVGNRQAAAPAVRVCQPSLPHARLQSVVVGLIHTVVIWLETAG